MFARSWPKVGFLFGMLYLVCALGCSGNSQLAPVKGKVTASGKPVSGGTITFAPIDVENAQPVVGEVLPDGTFVMTTERVGDGVAIGKHQVTYTAPNAEVTETTDGSDPIVKPSPFAGLVVQQPEVEVKSGQNEVIVELVRASR
jgi:hypothetical protein